MYYDIKESGKRIKNLRENAGLTQEVFSERIGISYRSIADIERGYRGTSIDVLIIIADIFNTTIDYLILGRSTYLSKRDLKANEYILSLLIDKSEKQMISVGKILKVILDNI